ncbi:MAG: S-layer homology domain-containing protein, partial [Ruminiclostridium sp.]
TSASINKLIKDKIYNDKTGIVQKKLEIIKNPNNLNIQGEDAQEVNKYLNQLYEEVKSELSYYLEDMLNGAGYKVGVLADKYDILKFSSPLGVKMSYKASSISRPYVLYGSVGNWQKLTQNLKYENGYLSYFVTGTGKYTIFSAKDVAASVADDSAAKPYISKLAASYDLTTVFPGAEVSFNSDLNVTVKEGILLYELLLEAQNDGQTDVKAKAKAYGLDKIINVTNIHRNITRQEAAAITIKIYCQKTGADYDKLRATYSKVIDDDSKIDGKYAVPVYLCLQMKVMTLDSSTNFNPKATINRAEIATVLQKMLEA